MRHALLCLLLGRVALSASAVAQAPLLAQASRPAPVSLPAVENRPLDVVATGPQRLTAAPGTTLGFGVRVRNRSGQPRALDVALGLPDGWLPLLTDARLVLAPGAETLRIVSVRVPADAAAGDYRVGVTVGDSAGVEGSVSRQVTVAARRGLSVQAVSAPPYVASGEAYRAAFVVANEGNAAATVHLDARSTLGSTLRLSALAVHLMAGEAAEVTVDAVTPTGLAERAVDRLQLRAVPAEGPPGGTPEPEAMATSAVEVVPHTPRVDPQPRWPLAATLSTVSDGHHVAPQIGLDGQMPLDVAGRHTIALHLVGPRRPAALPFADTPEAWAAYTGPAVYAHVGTGSFELSPATTTGAYGVAGRVEARRGRFDATAVLHRSAGRAVRESALGTSLGWRLGTASRASLNALGGAGDRPGAALTTRLELGRGGTVRVDAEGGVAVRDRVEPVYAVDLYARRGLVTAWGLARGQGRQYPGRASATTTAGGGLGLDLGRGARAEATWQRGRLAFGAPTVGAPTVYGLVATESARVRVEQAVGLGAGSLRLEGGVGREATHTSSAPIRAALDVRAGAGVRFGRLHATTRATVARSADALADGSTAWSVLTDAGHTGRRADVWAQVEASGGQDVHQAVPAARWAVAASGRVALAPGAWVRGEGRVGAVRMAGVSYGSASGQLEAGLGLPGGRELSASGQLFRTGPYSDLHLHLALRVPLRLPTPYRVQRPRIAGRFVDAETGRGLPDVLVRLGEASALTDADGAFTFVAPDGPAWLVVDRATLGPDRVPLTAFPLEVSGGDDVHVSVVRRAALSGRLQVYDVLGADARADTVAAAPVAHAVVEAAGAGQRHRRMTDEAGRFRFDDLPPGHYTLRVVRAVLPDRYRLEHDELAVVVAGEAEVVWRALPVHRPTALIAAPQRLSARGG